jgi:hypothetical protein
MATNKSNDNGIGLLTVLFLIFMVLKLTGHIDWSWWYVTLPLWGGVALFLAIFALIVLGGLVAVCGTAVFVFVESFFHKKGL